MDKQLSTTGIFRAGKRAIAEPVSKVYTNLDGVSVTLEPTMQGYVEYIKKERGYSREVQVRGVVGHSELGMHTRKANVIGVVALLRPGSDYFAYVILADGSILDGCWCQHSDGTFSVS
jgi:hypothetical protein